jgi:hypothetical protein
MANSGRGYAGRLLLGLLGALALALATPAAASAVPEWIHANANTCESCHHISPPSFQPCANCHPDVHVPNQKCTQCHVNKTTKGETCWQCHVPGAPQPEPIDPNCQACHGPMPHLGAQLGGIPGCTVCHGTDPTPHHDGIDQRLPTRCQDCHTDVVQGHAGNDCTACHRTDVHPHYPEVPATCNACHDAGVFNGRPDCLECHYGRPYFGQVDDDVHDDTLPDPPISSRSCRSCHPHAQKHAGVVPCLQCHDQATPFHHGTAASPGYPSCQTCHGELFQHGDRRLPCTDCHVDAHHQIDLPTPSPRGCNICHEPHTFGTRNCYGCHTPPVYHVQPRVPTCTGCHVGYRIHDALPSCTSCHRNIAAGHHVGRVTTKGCRAAGCHTQEYHVGRVSCQRCHRNAAHDPTPLNLPADRWQVCGRCHGFTQAVKQPCSDCHDETHHSATYRVPGCQACHEQNRHQQRVDCDRCHTNIDGGHHNVGRVSYRGCSYCHIGVQTHARETEAGRTAADEGNAFVCNTCHDGQVHGMLQPAEQDRCLDCHERAEAHAGGNPCIRCHWPAVHKALPVASEQGDYEPLELVLPPPSERRFSQGLRGRFSDTGFELLAAMAASAALLGLGLVTRFWPPRDPGGTEPDQSGGERDRDEGEKARD